MRFTPINIRKNWAFDHRLWMVRPVRRGNQWVKAANMANTAPILRT